jgi:hypothetical protein
MGQKGWDGWFEGETEEIDRLFFFCIFSLCHVFFSLPIRSTNRALLVRFSGAGWND